MSTGRDNRPRGNTRYLRRGTACVICRRRKMRCDGNRPICHQCNVDGKAEDCEYLTGQEQSKIQIMGQRIHELEARIQELQNPQVPGREQTPATAAMRFHQPYVVNSSDSSIQDPPRQIVENLLNGFLPFASDFGFFLNVPRFLASMLQPFPVGHPSRPSPALIFSTCLLATHISNNPLVKLNEDSYVKRATQEAATALSGNHPQKIMHSIQAEILLANYFFSIGDFFGGNFHVSNAASTAISSGLHKLRSSRPVTPTTLPLQRDVIEEGERIICAWNVLNLDRCWAVVFEDPLNFEFSSHTFAAKIDTPWPLDMDEFEQGLLPPNARTTLTVQNFLNGVKTVDIGLSTRGIEAKAIVLWDKTTLLSRKCPDAQYATQLELNEFAAIDAVIDHLKSSIPPPEQLPRFDPEKARRLAVGYSIINAAIIRLHRPFSTQSDASRRKRLAAALVILNIIIYLKPGQPSHINPIMGTVWSEAAQVVFDEMTFIRSSYSSSSLDGGSGDADGAFKLFNTVHQALISMNYFCTHSFLLSSQVGKIGEAYRAFSI